MQAELQRILHDAVRDGDLVGACAAVATPADCHMASAGARCAGAAMTPDTVVRVASMTKAVTTVAVLQLVEQQLLELDAPAGEIVPYLDEVQVFEGFDERGEPRLRPPARRITMRHLLTHTAGFGYDFADASLDDYVRRTGLPRAGGGLRRAHELPLLSDPGEQWRYGVSLDWAGQVVEALTGRPLGAHLRAAVLDPLGMHDTVFQRSDDQVRRSACVHLRGPAGLVPTTLDLVEDPEFTNAGGGLYSTARDYLRFLRMLLGEGELDGVRIVAPSSVRAMTRNQIGTLPMRGWRSVLPEFSLDLDLTGGIPKRWGLGFVITTEPTPEGRCAGALSWAGIANTHYWIDPAAGVAGLMMTQILPFLDEPTLRVFAAVERATYSHLGMTAAR
ncbi:serine hydrolase [Conexibacter sp. CPCC 206217]|uniref:serine hydrolase domain-containing protein n=1 Tax=Conexibacter sp. CPCC 206217 TaxID=3064574 RepID=UPI002720E844|nr:serine hydrolase domain-containing protein [Conexibacter sp. CPCC 206217]MDO8213161.1 serine hydrolase domain-containing protein [Conexibacter sp. CPCC 206217]